MSEWIPVSERLPDEYEETYLITTDSGYMCSCRWVCDISEEWGWSFVDVPQYTKVVAWMPLKPYSSDSEVVKTLESIQNYLCAGNPIWSVDTVREAMNEAIKAVKEKEHE